MPQHPDRLVRLAGASNFRDLGGYPGHDGRTVRWRRLFRSDHLGALTAEDQAVLAELGVSRALDFRGAQEAASAAYAVPSVRRHALTIEPTVAQNMQAIVAEGRKLDLPVVVGLMEDLYRAIVNRQSHRLAEFFEHVLDADEPLVFHCTAGKDRTGVAAALLLMALGVSRDLVQSDYLLTNDHYRAPHAPRHDVPPEAMAALWSVRPAYLDAAFDAIDQQHGGVERYLRERIGLTHAARRTLVQRCLEAG